MKSQKEIIEIMNQARCYETDKNKTLPFTYRECERAVEIALKFKEKEMLDDEIKFLKSIDVYTGYNGTNVQDKIKERLQKLKGDEK